jgi:tRNA G10  N-methylase Trm11
VIHHSALVGNNADLIPHIAALYIPLGSVVADVTYGRGVFWQGLDTTQYDFRPSDLLTGVDFLDLPYEDRSIDCLTLDPPYMHGGKTVHKNINACYQNGSVRRGHESIIRLYAGGILEAARVLRKKGVIIVKCQDEIESSKQRWSHVEIIQLLQLFGFEVVDLFVLVQNTVPMLQHKEQQHSRKNHSYALVARFRR